MLLADLDYPLPPEAIAQQPVEPRDAARLLVDHGPELPPAHLTVHDLPASLRPGDLLVVNRTRVLPARLLLHKATGGAAEVLLLEELAPGRWEALVRPGKRLKPGTVLEAGSDLTVTIGEERGDDGCREVHLDHEGELLAVLDRYGEVPLPPYVHEHLADPERYQTVFGDHPGSVAAPTAGLHLTPDLLTRCQDAGARVAQVELVVGLGTFRPITAEVVEDHMMHAERYVVEPQVLGAAAEAERVVAIGTTTVRALESAAASGQASGKTDLFITPGYHFQVVDLLLTNFHLPRSSLLVLVQALIGSRWRDLYATALDEGYRFLSFGDAMLLERTEGAR
jgi:S-adenosylmethionine:tRNA ribosyltransferase-isomerase